MRKAAPGPVKTSLICCIMIDMIDCECQFHVPSGTCILRCAVTRSTVVFLFFRDSTVGITRDFTPTTLEHGADLWCQKCNIGTKSTLKRTNSFDSLGVARATSFVRLRVWRVINLKSPT